MRPKSTVAIALLCGLLAGVVGCTPSPSAVAVQNSTIDALLDGNYDGDVTFAQLGRHGDFGLGTFNALDGEMVAIPGRFLQVRSDGTVRVVPPEERTPFSVVTFFHADTRLSLQGPLTYRQLQDRLTGMRGLPVPLDGRAFAFAITGRFKEVKTRSVPRQQPPYPRLADVVPRQSVFDLHDIDGTLVGFWFPENLRHVNVPGYHFHFVTKDQSAGGHVLDLTLDHATAEMQELAAIEILLPEVAPTTRPAQSRDRVNEMEKVEK